MSMCQGRVSESLETIPDVHSSYKVNTNNSNQCGFVSDNRRVGECTPD